MGHIEVTYVPASAKPIMNASVSIAEAKANFSSLISGVAKKHKPITILKRGVAVAQIVPMPDIPKPLLRGSMAGTARELGDIVNTNWEEWTVNDEW